MSIDGADKTVQKATFFADVALAHGAVEHFAHPTGGAVNHQQQEKYAEIFKGVQREHTVPPFRVRM